MHNCRFPFLDCPGCDRCAVPVDRFEANAALRRSLATNIAWFAQGALVFTVSFVLIFGAAYWGLSRAEQAYQSAQRI